MEYYFETYQFTENGFIQLDYHLSDIFIEQKDADSLLNDDFVKKFRKTYGDVIGVILNKVSYEKPCMSSNNKGLLGVI